MPDDDALDTLLILIAAGGDAESALDAAVRPLGLTGSEFRLLQFLDRIAPAAVSMATTAAELGLTPSGFSRLVARLVERGAIVRSADTRDSRAGLVHLTAAGHALLKDAAHAAQARAASTFRRVSIGQRKQLERLLSDLALS